MIGSEVRKRIALAAFVVSLSGGAHAASLAGPVEGWSSGVPAYISMYEYVPDTLAAAPPIVVAAHYCNGSASALFSYAGIPDLVAAADTYGFIMIFPQTTNANSASKNCWDVGSQASLTRDGGGDTQAIAQMVQHTIDTRDADPARVYIMGVSSGAMLTQAMLGFYPDVFKAGSEFSGVPAGCWASGYSASSNWSEPCAQGTVTKTAAEWGALLEAMYPGYSGYRPRLQLWHGTADTTIDYANQTEAIKEWTNILALDTTPSSSEMPAGYQVEKWQNACGFTVLEAHTQDGGGHSTPVNADSIVAFFGLEQTGPDPQVAACGPNGDGSGEGAGGSGGSIGSTTTSTAADGATTTASGTSSSTSSAGGTSGNDSDISSSSTSATNSSTNTSSSASTTGSDGTSASSGSIGVLGSTSTTSSALTTGAGGVGPPSLADESDSGCNCKLEGGRGSGGAARGLWMLALGVLLRRRARSCTGRAVR